MKSRLFNGTRTLVAILSLIAFGSSVSRSVENSGILNPVDLGTLPSGSYQSDPIRSPVGIDINGNLVITGNVRRGMHFRDTVPYDSTTSFKGTLGSSSLNSFLRDSAGPEDLTRSTNQYGIQPYYLQSRTVATTRPGYSGVFRPSGTILDNRRLQGGFTTGTYMFDSDNQTLLDSDTSAALPVSQGVQTQYKTPVNPPTIVKSIRELKLLTQQTESNDRQMVIEKYRKQNNQTQDNTQKPQTGNQQDGISFESMPGPEHNRQSVIEKYKFVEPPVPGLDTESEQTVMPDISSMATAEKHTQANSVIPQDGIPGLDITEQVKKQLEDLTTTIEKKEKQETGLKGKDIMTNIGLSSDAFKWGESSYNSTKSAEDRLNELKKFSRNDLSAEADEIIGTGTDSDTFSMRRFNHHFQEAQDHLQRGRYYVAVDSFAMALIYKPNDPLCLAGRGHALLAAGEYISSALFLSRAIEAYPEYAGTRINLAVMLGGPNILDVRIADIKEWQQRSGSGQLDFLLGYIYYRTGRLGPARKAINSAYVKLPQSGAIAIVKKAVDDALAGK
ncbi:MAG: tetratricopeptide repeat protein [Sedimentisphaerales bacterium]|nr:tetratricopeptide repeat protein [Sedimentisphaerales bacterium]